MITHLQKFNYNRYEKKFIKFLFKQLNCDERYVKTDQATSVTSTNSTTKTNKSPKK